MKKAFARALLALMAGSTLAWSTDMGLATGAEAAQSLTGSISGMVTAGGAPAEGVYVYAYIQPYTEPGPSRGTYTGADGSYTIPSLAVGTYVVSFHHPSEAYISMWYDNIVSEGQDGATAIQVTAGALITGIDASFNLRPTLAALANTTISEDAGQQAVSLDGITAGSGESQTLTVTAASSNTALIPHPAVSYTSPNSTGSLTFTPVANASGSATITVMVDDGDDVDSVVSRSFTVTVNEVNDPPTLDPVVDMTVRGNAGRQTIQLSGITAGAGESQNLTVTATSSNEAVIPTPTVTYASPGSTGSVTFIPIVSASGAALITVTVSDGQAAVSQSSSITVTAAGTNDFNADSRSDVLWRDTAGTLAVWYMDGPVMTGSDYLTPNWVPANWLIAGTGDFNADGSTDILWQDTGGTLAVWYMDGPVMTGSDYLTPSPVTTNWGIVGTGDFNVDGKPDILWRDTTGTLAVWYMDGVRMTGSDYLNPNWVPTNWVVKGTGDFNADGKPDILWQDTTGILAVWYLEGAAMTGSDYLTPDWVPTSWLIVGSGDFNADGTPDILWRESTGTVAVWYMDGPVMTGSDYLSPSWVPTNWVVVGSGGAK